MLASLGLSGPLFGTRLLPVGTLYDPFIARGLDSLNYACYQGARFMVVATPSGISLAPEGGAHQSVSTPLIGMGQPGLLSFEPAYADEVAEIMTWGFNYMQADDGGAVYLRLSTRPQEQPEREMTADLRHDIVSGGYWLREPDPQAPAVIVYTGAVVPEVLQAREMLEEELPGIGVLAVTSADKLYAGWQARVRRPNTPVSHLEKLMGDLGPETRIITVQDGHPANLSWIGSALGRRLFPLGVTGFGQSGDLPDLYQTYGLDAESIMDAVAAACVDKARGTPMAV